MSDRREPFEALDKLSTNLALVVISGAPADWLSADLRSAVFDAAREHIKGDVAQTGLALATAAALIAPALPTGPEAPQWEPAALLMLLADTVQKVAQGASRWPLGERVGLPGV